MVSKEMDLYLCKKCGTTRALDEKGHRILRLNGRPYKHCRAWKKEE